MSASDTLFRHRTKLDGRDVEMVLAVVPYEDIARFLEGLPRDEGQAAKWMTSRLMRELKSLDGDDLYETAPAMLKQPDVLGSFVYYRNQLFDESRRAGRMFALCPSCKTEEAEITLAYLELRLGFTPPPITTPDTVWLEPPALGGAFERGRRHGDLPLAGRIRFELPSKRWGIEDPKLPTGGTMQVLNVHSESVAWERFFPDGTSRPEGHGWWRSTNQAFRALIRLTAAIASFDRGGEPSPALLQKMPAFDVAYLDLAVMAAQFTDEPPLPSAPPVAGGGTLPRPRNLPVDCQRCGTRYLPLL